MRHHLSLGMRADLAAERLFVHHNTVRYRLRRYEELNRYQSTLEFPATLPQLSEGIVGVRT